MSDKIYLFANNGSLTTAHIDQIGINPPEDVVVLFNYMYVPYDSFDNVANRIAFLRVVYENHEENIHYLGGVEFLEKQNDFSKLVCVDDYGKYSEYTSNVTIPHELLHVESFLSEHTNIEYPDSKIPTTGFLAFLYMKRLYPNSEITLVGFTGHYADGSVPSDSHHDYNWEQSYYKQNDVKRICTTQHMDSST